MASWVAASIWRSTKAVICVISHKRLPIAGGRFTFTVNYRGMSLMCPVLGSAFDGLELHQGSFDGSEGHGDF